MKKLLTLVLALALAFAAAAPALALGGDPIPKVNRNDNIDISLALYSGHLTTTTDLEKLTPWTQNVLKDQEITIVVGITKKTASGTDAVHPDSFLSFEATGLKKDAATWAATDGSHDPFGANNYSYSDSTKKTTIVPLSAGFIINSFTNYGRYKQNETEYFFIRGTVSGALSATVTLDFYASAFAADTNNDDVMVFAWFNSLDYRPYDYEAFILNKPLGKALDLNVGKNGAVDEISWCNFEYDINTGYITPTNAAPLAKTNVVNANGVNEPQWSTGSNTPLPKTEQAAIDAMFKQFGFNWDHLNGYALPITYIYAQCASAQKSVSINNPLYTDALTVSDPTTVPATGDMSAVGIALAIAALAAAGFVTAKRSRA